MKTKCDQNVIECNPQTSGNRDGVSTNPLKKPKKKDTQYRKSAKALVFSMSPTTVIPIPWLVTVRIPITFPRGTPMRWRALKCTLGFSRTRTCSTRMNGRRGFGTFANRRVRRRKTRGRLERLSAQSRTNRILFVSKRGAFLHPTTVLLIERIR